MISIQVRPSYLRLSYFMGFLRDFRPGMQWVMPFSRKASRNQVASVTACRLGYDRLRPVFMPPFMRPIRRPAPLYLQAECRAVRFEIGSIDNDHLALTAPGREAIHLRDKDTLITLSLPVDVKRHRQAMLSRRVPPSQPVAIDENVADHQREGGHGS